MDINAEQNQYLVPNYTAKPCYVVNITALHGIWQNENPLSQSFPLLAMQLAFITAISRIVYFILRPFNVPHLVSDIISGIVIGPSCLGKWEAVAIMFPLKSVIQVETVAYWALTCHVFLIGLEMDTTSIMRTGTKTIYFAVAGILLPLIFGFILSFLYHAATEQHSSAFFWASPFVVTGFPVVARILSDLRILHTDIGRIGMPVAMICDLVSWVFLVLLIPARLEHKFDVPASFVASVAFVLFSVYVVRPGLQIIIRHTSKGNSFNNEYYLCFILVCVSLFALVTEFLGSSSLVGAFVFGLIMPDRGLAGVLIERFEDSISLYLLPFFFTICGLRMRLSQIHHIGAALFVVILSVVLKIASGLATASYLNMSRQEGLAIGLVMNTKGILALIIINVGFDAQKLSGEDYAVLVIAIILSTAIVPPLLSFMYCPSRRLSQYKRRTIQKSKQYGEFRILACLQDFRNVPGMINLLDSSNATKESPLTIFALHLIEITGRASPTLIVHSTGKSGGSYNNKKDAYSEQIVNAFQTYQNLNDLVTVHALTSLSPFGTMHDDIVNLAEDKQIALMILPFHKLPSGVGKLEEEANTVFRGVNVNVIAKMPCSVGIFIDKGLGNVTSAESNLSMRKVCLYFIGGPDDREGLAYAWRMAGSQWVSLTVVRFLPGNNVEEIEPIDLPAGEANRLLTSTSYIDRQTRLDDEYVNEFRLKTAEQQSVVFEEKIVNNDEETVAAIKEMHHDFDLYIVGKGDGIISPLTAPMLDWCEFPELGAIGDLLASARFTQGSVLVMHQYGSPAQVGSDLASSMDRAEGSAHGMVHVESWRRPPAGEDDGGVDEEEPFAKRKEKEAGQST